MLIKRTSLLTGAEREMDLDISNEQITAHSNGALIQKVMANLSEDEREFYLTGVTRDEWENTSIRHQD
jgi:hypothetical protein